MIDWNERPVQAGAVFCVKYPFVKEPYEKLEEDGPYTIESWRPGVSIEYTGDYRRDMDVWAAGEGRMILTVVGRFKPKGYPERVFYTRKFIDPDDNIFGKNKLLISTLEKFKRHATGYALAYEVGDAQ